MTKEWFQRQVTEIWSATLQHEPIVRKLAEQVRPFDADLAKKFSSLADAQADISYYLNEKLGRYTR